jgi:hypothetical protein
VDEEKMLKLLENVPKGIGDKALFIKTMKENVELKISTPILEVNISGLIEAAWNRYKAWRG